MNNDDDPTCEQSVTPEEQAHLSPTDRLTIKKVSAESFSKLMDWVDALYDSHRNPTSQRLAHLTRNELEEHRTMNEVCSTSSRYFLEETLTTSLSPAHMGEAWRASPLLDLPRILHLQILWGYFMAHMYDDVREYSTPSSLQKHLHDNLDIEVDIRTITEKIQIGRNLGRYETQQLYKHDKRYISIYPTRITTREWRCIFMIRMIARHNITDLTERVIPLLDHARNAIGIKRKKRAPIHQHRLNKNPPKWDTGPFSELPTSKM